MKAIVALILAAAMCFGGAVAENGSALGLRALEGLWDGKSNQVISPVSLAWALDMAGAGAAGKTREEIYAALGVEDTSIWNEALAAAGLRWANAAFLRDDLEVKPEYSEALTQRFGAERFGLEDADGVNAWVDAHTDHLIDHLVDDIDPMTRLMLVNAVAMDADWALPFDPMSTDEDIFHAPGGDVRAQFMHATREMPYAEGPLGQAVRLNYRGGGLYMLALLPEEGRMAEALAAVAEDPAGCFGELTPRRVKLSMPKLDLSAENSLKEQLQALGIVEAFSDSADLSGIADEPLMISEVFQKARMQVDEEGTRAAAATEVEVLAKGAFPMDPPAVMTLDRPCILLVLEETTGAVCFAAVVCDPTT